jgi:hypothetical protein
MCWKIDNMREITENQAIAAQMLGITRQALNWRIAKTTGRKRLNYLSDNYGKSGIYN